MDTGFNKNNFDHQCNPPTSAQPVYDMVLVDDDYLVLEIVQRKLCKSSLLINCIQNPEEAVEFLLANQTRLLIVDYRMPQMNGLELIERLKDYPLMSETNVFIASSVKLPPQTEAKALELDTHSLLKDKFSEPGYLEKFIHSQVAD